MCDGRVAALHARSPDFSPKACLGHGRRRGGEEGDQSDEAEAVGMLWMGATSEVAVRAHQSVGGMVAHCEACALVGSDRGKGLGRCVGFWRSEQLHHRG